MTLIPGQDPPSFPYLIITHDSLISYWDPFVDWLNRQGFRTGILASETIINYGIIDDPDVADHADLLRGYLKYAFENRGLKWVLLGGVSEPKAHGDIYNDYVNVPVRYAINPYWDGGDVNCDWTQRNRWIPSDYYFAELGTDWEIDGDGMPGERNRLSDVPSGDGIGNDFEELPLHWELFVSRVPAINGEDITTWIQKVLNYEQNPGNGSYDYLFTAFWGLAEYHGYTYLPPYFEGYPAWVQDAMDAFPPNYNFEIREELPDGFAENPISPEGDEIIDMINEYPGFVNWYYASDVFEARVRTPFYNQYPINRLNFSAALGCLGNDDHCGMDNLLNFDKPGFTYAVGPGMADFTCAYEGGLRERCIGCNNILWYGGSAAFIGSTRYSSVEPAKRNFLNALFLDWPDDYARIGPAFEHRAMWATSMDKVTNVILGSPEMQIWTQIPSHFDVQVDFLNDRVRVLDGSDPIENATVCFASRSLHRYSVVVTNVDGYAEVTPGYEFDITRETDITVTKHNYIPYQIIGSGPIDKNIYWRGDIAFYGDITVPAGKTLTIKPGATIKTAGTELAVNGTLKIEGTSEHHVIMTSISAEPEHGDWTGIRVYANGALDMDYCDISYTECGVEAQAGTSIRANQCDITHFVYFGITIDGYCAVDPFIGGCHFQYGGSDEIGFEDPLAINVLGGNPTIDGNSVAGMDGIFFFGDPSDFPVIQNNRLAGPGSFGILATRGSVELGPSPQILTNADSLYSYGMWLSYCYGEGTSVQGNRCARNYVAGLHVDRGSPPIIGGSSPLLLVNKFCDNYGSGISIGKSCQSQVRGNAIKRNGQYGILVSGSGSAPCFGDAQNPGNNSISGTIFDAHNSTANTIMAQGNYWNSGCPPIQIYGSWNTSNCLTADPHPNAKPAVGPGQLPQEFVLHNCFPNPFNASTSLSFELPREQHVRLSVYNILGQNVRTLVNSAFAPGVHSAVWDGRTDGGDEVGSGVYFFLLSSEDYRASNKMTLMR